MTKRVRKKKKKKIKIFRVLIALIVLAGIGFGVVKFLDLTKEIIIDKTYYLSSSNNEIKTYTYNEETKELAENEEPLYRGIKVKSNDKMKTIDEVNYILVKLDDVEYYIKEDNLTEDENNVVTETEKYVRTSVTVYKNENDSKIASFVKKGNKLDILGYDYIDDKGLVNMYKIKNGDIEGWVYRKYLVDTEEAAKANYNENGVYDTHKDRRYGFELYGGKASTLDYYPYERVEFEDNPIEKVAKTMYLNAGTISGIDSYLEVAKSSGVNAMVVDIKDGVLAYPV